MSGHPAPSARAENSPLAHAFHRVAALVIGQPIKSLFAREETFCALFHFPAFPRNPRRIGTEYLPELPQFLQAVLVQYSVDCILHILVTILSLTAIIAESVQANQIVLKMTVNFAFEVHFPPTIM